MAAIGIILLIVNQNNSKPWYIWFLIIGGIIVGIIGGILLAFALSSPAYTTCCPQPQVVRAPVQYVAAPQPQVPLQVIPQAQPQVMIQAQPQYVQAPQYVAAPQPQYIQAPLAPGAGGVQAGIRNIGGAQVPYTASNAQGVIDNDTFNPRPQTYVAVVPGEHHEITARGPYGPGGTQAVVSGDYKAQDRVVAQTIDYGEHPVDVRQPQYLAPAPVQYAPQQVRYAPTVAPVQYAPAPQPIQYVMQ